MTNFQIIKRLFKTYTKNYLNKILLSIFFSLLVAGSTSSIAWLLDPAIEKIFIEKNQTLILIIPGLIILADYFPPVNRLLIWAKKKARISDKKEKK